MRRLPVELTEVQFSVRLPDSSLHKFIVPRNELFTHKVTANIRCPYSWVSQNLPASRVAFSRKADGLEYWRSSNFELEAEWQFHRIGGQVWALRGLWDWNQCTWRKPDPPQSGTDMHPRGLRGLGEGRQRVVRQRWLGRLQGLQSRFWLWVPGG